MTVNADARITIDEANRFAQEMTGGEMSVVRESECIQLCRKGYFIVKEFIKEGTVQEVRKEPRGKGKPTVIYKKV